MRVLIAEPFEIARPADVNSMGEIQRIVGGNIQAFSPWDDGVCIVCNAARKERGMPFNRVLEDFNIMTGPFVVCGIDGRHLRSLTDEQMQKYEKKFHYPQFLTFTSHGALPESAVLAQSCREVHHLGSRFAAVEYDPEIVSYDRIASELLKPKSKKDPEKQK